METKTLSSRHHLFAITVSVFSLFLAIIPKARADAVSEMAGFSVFDKVDLAELARSDVKTAHGVPMSTARFISVQSCWVAPGTTAQQIAAMRQWNPTKHPELKVFLHSDIPGSPNVASFARLKNAPDNDVVRSLVSATEELSSELQISKAEAKKSPPGKAGTGGGVMSAPVVAFWTNILASRAQTFASGGSAAQAAYDHSGEAIRPGAELSGMLREQEKIRRQFSGFLENTGIGRGAGSIKPELYWELLKVEDDGVLTLGASYSRAGANGTYQAADTLYYASGGYYSGVTLYQMWPVNAGGHPSTLVWRGDMISAASLASLHGIEKLASESSMMKDVAKAVTLFRRDTAGGR
ncbi:MAG: hypothetical protein ABJB22_02760 [Verrucomicrobiota bacterium]